MFIKESTVFMSIGLPIAIIYILTIISTLQNKKTHIPLRDICISVIALDIYELVSLLEGWGGFNEFIGAKSMLVICISLLITHITLIFYIKKLPKLANEDKINKKIALIRDAYIGICFLMTNAVSFVALIEMAGGIN